MTKEEFARAKVGDKVVLTCLYSNLGEGETCMNVATTPTAGDGGLYFAAHYNFQGVITKLRSPTQCTVKFHANEKHNSFQDRINYREIEYLHKDWWSVWSGT